MTPLDIANLIIAALDQVVVNNYDPVEYTYNHTGSFDIALFGQVTKILIAHYQAKGWKNVEIGRVTMRDGQSFIAFHLVPQT
ncbi:MAG: hypothetical protein G8345_01250 [Magnetococcales bacterium]|nr:hypothetical protein [Magnetococcales bacterium]NGZ25497.1 hypothetical protein [Magnetococcales bacterium]